MDPNNVQLPDGIESLSFDPITAIGKIKSISIDTKILSNHLQTIHSAHRELSEASMNKSMTNSMKKKWENGFDKAFDVCHQLCNKIIGHTTNKTAIKYLEQRLKSTEMIQLL